ncbi:MAG TPA: glycerate kinase [Candidatus Limnocylindrales bacterium]
MTVLFAPDSFKGSLSSVEVASALAAGWAAARPGDVIEHAPLGDGGEGTIRAVAFAGGWSEVSTTATDPLGRPTAATWLRSDDGARAYVELAEASGLSRVDSAARDPMAASTRGTGELLCEAIDAGVRRVIVGIGGSATTDGGRGILEALGALDDGATVDLSRLDPRLAGVDLEIACDVTNPLLGAAGAAATYGPQKGATAAQVAELDARLAAWADRLERATGRRERDTPGAGAAGGTGFGLLCLADRVRSLHLRPGVELVMEAAGFEAKLGRAHLVVTGEGRVDEQTAFGKTALGVARRAAAGGVPCVAVGGGVTPAGLAALAPLGAVVVPVVERPQSVEDAIAAGAEPVLRCGERIARLISAGEQAAASSPS